MNIQTITNVTDCVPLYIPHSLYLKRHSKFNISVSLPADKLGKTISNYDIMERLTSAIKPDKYAVLKVVKSTVDFIRFEAELDDRSKLKNVLARLDGRTIKLSGFSELFKVRASEAKDDFPKRHDWDSYFRDAKDMDEMKPGERPDTIHLSNLPIRWFCPRHMENDEDVKPSENIFKRIFEKFGSIRYVDIPICDPYRSQMKTEIQGTKAHRFDQDIMFEGYVQFSEYVGFVKTMDEFRGMKLVRKCGDKNLAVNISVDFDKTKHLTDASIKRRNIVRDKLIQKEKTKQEQEARKKKLEEERQEQERKKQEELKQKEIERQRQREEQRKQKHLRKLQEKGQLELTTKIQLEERKLLIAQRKLESIRILGALFERFKLKENQIKETKGQTSKENLRANKNKCKLGQNDLRNKLMNKYKSAHEELLNKQQNKLNKVREKSSLSALLRNAKEDDRSPSINTVSSDDSVLSDSHQKNSSKKKKLKKKKNADETSDSESSSSSKPKTDGIAPVNPFASQLYNPKLAAEWLQMGIYPYAPAMIPSFPAIRPDFFPPNPSVFRGIPSTYRGRFPRGRGRGEGPPWPRNQYNNRRYSPYSHNNYYKYFKSIAKDHDYPEHDYKNEHDDRRNHSRSSSRSRSRSRSYSRSRKRSRSYRARSRSKSRPRRSRSRNKSTSRSRRRRSRSSNSSSKSRNNRHRSRSRSKSRSRSRSHSRSKPKVKLASTRRSRSSSGWTKSRSRSRSRTWSRERKSADKIALQPKKLIQSAKEIQKSVQRKLHDRLVEEEAAKARRTEQNRKSNNTTPDKERSLSVDSSKFISPKRKKESLTPT